MEDINRGKLDCPKGFVAVEEWFKWNSRSNDLDESHLLTVDTSKPILLGEISPGRYSIIDGNHRIEKAMREALSEICCFTVSSRQLLNYFIDERGYLAYIDYWNEKVKDLR